MLKISHFFLAGALCVANPLYAQTPSLTSPVASFPLRPAGPPGLRREAGAWLFNDSIFALNGENRGAVGGPVFLSNLRRDKKNKLPLFLPQKSAAPLRFSTLPLPSLREISAPNFDFGALGRTLAAQVNAARAAGQIYIGWGIAAGVPTSSGPLASASATAALGKLRAALDAVAPDSALLLEVDALADPLLAVADLDAAAPSCDAVILRVSGASRSGLWPLKMARRVAEEQRDYDLPIFVAPGSAAEQAAFDKPAFEARLLEFWMGGATGFVLEAGQVPAWANVIARNPGLISGVVTLEDAAVLPSLNPRSLGLVEQLRAAGRLPLVGRVPEAGRNPNARGESVFAVLDELTSLDTLSALDRAARNGNSVYLEGLPDLRQAALLSKMSDMTGTQIEVLPAPKSEILTLSDAWLFGEARGREFAVNQRVKWTIKTSLAAQARKKRGEDALEAFSAARLAGDENGLLVAPLGKGRVLWLAHSPVAARPDDAARRDYYAAIAGGLQGGLARLSFDAGEESARSSAGVRFALRASKVGTPIIALFNDAATDVNLTLTARGDSPVALDLLTEREIAAKVSGYSSTVRVTVPARGFTWLTFGPTRAALDKERLAARPKAKTR